MAFPVQGKTALVTGAGSGISLAFASLLLQKGCNVLIADLTLRPESQKLVDESQGKTPRAVFEKTDVTAWGDLEQAIATAVKEFGAVDVFCAGAGVFEPLAISHLLARKAPGAIIHISSIAAQIPTTLVPLYGLSKAAVSSLIRSLGPLEAQVGIRVSGVAPSLTKTPLFTDNPDKMALFDETKNEWTSPTEVAEAMLSLIEDPEIESGTVLETVPNGTRKVSILNDPGPSGKSTGGAHGPAMLEEVYTKLKNEGI